MRAAVCRGFGEPLSIEEVSLRAPEAGEVRVRLAACAICHSDIHFVDGAWGGTLPAVYGHEGSGTVVECGPGVENLREGDRVVTTLIRSCGACYFCRRGFEVACQEKFVLDERSPLSDAGGMPLVQGMRIGAFAEEVTIHASQAVPVSDELPFAEAALLACGVLTGVGAVQRTAQVPQGASVVVIGIGGVGLNVVQAARQAGAHPLIAIEPDLNKRRLAQKLGATSTFDLVPDLYERVRECTDGRGADFVFVTVGVKSALVDGKELLAPQGSLILVGMPASDETFEINPSDLAALGQRIIGSKMGSARIAEDIPHLASRYISGDLRLSDLISARYRLDDINEALSESRRGRAIRNLIVFPHAGEN